MTNSSNYTIVTPTYRADLDVVSRLCSSIDKHATDDVVHVLVVPAQDAHLFKGLVSDRRQVITKEDVIGRSTIALPVVIRRIPKVILGKREKEIWFSIKSLRFVRGWIVQQLIKLATPQFTQTDHIVCVDSDVVFIRKFSHATFLSDGKLLFYAKKCSLPRTHQIWQRSAENLIGAPVGNWDTDYMNSVVPLHRTLLCDLHRRIETTQGKDWMTSLMTSRELSEYFLYGVFCREELAAGRTELLTTTSNSFVHSSSYGRYAKDDFIRSLPENAIAVNLQSTMGIDHAERIEIIQQIEKHAGVSE